MQGPVAEAQEPAQRLAPLRLVTAAFLASSIAVTLTLSPQLTVVAKALRWLFLGLATVLALTYAVRSSLSRQAVAWLGSALYAAGTVIYTIDIPVTVLRSVTFAAVTVGGFAGGYLCYRQPATRPHRLPGRIGSVLTLLAVPSFVGYIAGYPEQFFYAGGLFRGVFAHPNTVGAFGAMWLVVGVGTFDTRLSRYRSLLLIGLIAMVLCLVASRSRAGVGGAAISILFYVLGTRRVQRLAFAAIFAATLLLSALVVLPFATEAAVRGSGDFMYKWNEDDLLASRRDVWEVGQENFLASPWVGYGFGTSIGEETKEWKLVGLGGREKGSALIGILEETGILGTLVMGFPVGLCVLYGLRIKRLNTYLAGGPEELKIDARLAAAFWAGAMGGLANNMAEATLWSAGSPFGGMLLFLAGAAEGLAARTEERL